MKMTDSARTELDAMIIRRIGPFGPAQRLANGETCREIAQLAFAFGRVDHAPPAPKKTATKKASGK